MKLKKLLMMAAGGQSPSYGDKVKTLLPLAYWPLNETSGTAAVNYGSLGTAVNGAYTGVDLANTAAPGGTLAPLFDGANDLCNIYSATMNTNWNRAEGSLAAWMKVYDSGVWSDGTVRRLFVLQTTSAQETIAIYRNTTNGRLTYVYTAGGTSEAVNNDSNSSTAWTHVAATYSKTADQFMAYKNGVQVGTTQTSLGTSSGNALSNATSLIGAGVTTPIQIWYGWLAHVALWNRPLTPTEIANLYAWGL